MVGIRWVAAKLGATMSQVEATVGGEIQGGIGSVCVGGGSMRTWGDNGY